MKTMIMKTIYKDGREYAKRFFSSEEIEKDLRDEGRSTAFIDAFFRAIGRDGKVVSTTFKYELVTMEENEKN